jgi:uncharacterized protein with GYD domain
MKTYVTVCMVTDEGRKAINDTGQRLAEVKSVFEGQGAKVLELWVTFGRYDFVLVWQAPDDATAFRLAAQVAQRAAVQTETWPAMPFDEFVSSMR